MGAFSLIVVINLLNRYDRMVQSKKKAKAATFPSHEFFIQNHGDIAVTIMALFFIGMVFQPTNKMASKVLFLNYNISTENISILHERPHTFNYFVSGPLDWCNILYYAVGCIVGHALIQEYLLDKILKKSHLSKSKLSKFNESAQLGIFTQSRLRFWDTFFTWSSFPCPFHFFGMTILTSTTCCIRSSFLLSRSHIGFTFSPKFTSKKLERRTCT